MREFVLTIVRELADHPGAVRVAEIDGRQTAVLELRCDARDVGRLIGRKGRTIVALQTLVSVLASRQKRRALLEVAE